MSTKPLVRVVLAAAVLGFALAVPATALAAPATGAKAEVVPPQIILKSQTVPAFPPAAKAGRFSGTVMLETTILKDGSVGDVEVLDCTRPKVGFEEAATAAVKKWKFEPGRREGEPVEYVLRFRLNFSGGGPGQKEQVSAGTFTTDSGTSSVGGSTSSGGRVN